jgi:hypothetical protein
MPSEANQKQKLDRFLTVQEVSDALQLDRRTVVRLFENEPDVLIVGAKMSTRAARRYRTLRIPQSTYNRKVRQLSNRKVA